MPLFEYRCRSCATRFEVVVFGGEAPDCPRCGETRLDKLLSVFAVGNGGALSASPEGAAACGSCGDPRGPGACRN